MAKVAGHTGMRVDDARLLTATNLVQELLIYQGKWPGLEGRFAFCVYDGVITLPRFYVTLIKASDVNCVIPVHNQWFEFLGYGPGQQNSETGWINGIIDRGEMPVARQPAADELVVRVRSFEDERDADGTRAQIRVFGYGNDDVWIRTQDATTDEWYDGVKIDLRGDDSVNWADSLKYFSSITKVLKPATVGRVELTYLAADASETFCATYMHDETHPSFRTYYLPGVDSTSLPDGLRVYAWARRRFIPVTGDDDEMMITNLPALRSGLIALRMQETDKFRAFTEHFNAAKAFLTAESEIYNGPINPPMDMQDADFGFSDVENVR